MARQYFNSTPADSLIAAITTTPTTVKTALLSQAQANLYLPLPFGSNVPFAGQVFRFTLGGLITTPASGTLIIDPYYGSNTSVTTFGTDMGASAAQTMTVSLTNSPFRIQGEICFRSIGAAATASTAWLTGNFWGQGTLATAGSGWGIAFGSTAAVTVDTTGTIANQVGYGNLNFAVTFSVTGGTIVLEYSSMQALN